VFVSRLSHGAVKVRTSKSFFRAAARARRRVPSAVGSSHGGERHVGSAFFMSAVRARVPSAVATSCAEGDPGLARLRNVNRALKEHLLRVSQCARRTSQKPPCGVRTSSSERLYAAAACASTAGKMQATMRLRKSSAAPFIPPVMIPTSPSRSVSAFSTSHRPGPYTARTLSSTPKKLPSHA
jgi:hypothetical protein